MLPEELLLLGYAEDVTLIHRVPTVRKEVNDLAHQHEQALKDHGPVDLSPVLGAEALGVEVLAKEIRKVLVGNVQKLAHFDGLAQPGGLIHSQEVVHALQDERAVETLPCPPIGLSRAVFGRLGLRKALFYAAASTRDTDGIRCPHTSSLTDAGPGDPQSLGTCVLERRLGESRLRTTHHAPPLVDLRVDGAPEG